MTLSRKRFYGAQKHCDGFSFLELAIIITILGAVFMMALKGGELVESVQAFMTRHKVQVYQQQIQLYITDHHYLPGDDPHAAERYGRPQSIRIMFGAPVSTTGDNKIDGYLSSTLDAAGEQYMAWRDLRYAGLIDGDPELAGESAMPENPFGGVYGFDEGNLGQERGSICATRIPGRAAQIIDGDLDDGVIDTGKVVATSRFDPVAASNHFEEPDSDPYDVEKEYIICFPIQF